MGAEKAQSQKGVNNDFFPMIVGDDQYPINNPVKASANPSLLNIELCTRIKLKLILQVIAQLQVEVIVILKVVSICFQSIDIDRCRCMKNVTITLSKDILQVLDNIG